MTKYILAEYSCYSRFKVPTEIDLENVNWWIKHNILHIELADGKILEIEPDEDLEIDAKYPTNTEIVEAE